MYGSIGNKDEAYKIWPSYELAFSMPTNKSYICLISSLVRMGDIEGVEAYVRKWLSVKSFDDIIVSNFLLYAYTRQDHAVINDVLEHCISCCTILKYIMNQYLKFSFLK